jgi:hypothetical protein
MRGTTQPLDSSPKKDTKEKSKNLPEKYVGESGEEIGLGKAIKVMRRVRTNMLTAITKYGSYLLKIVVFSTPID